LNKVSISILLLCTQILLVACTPIKTPASNQYKLEAFSANQLSHKKTTLSILVSQPEAMAGYQTEQMLYVQKPFEIAAFVHNTWISSPANMIYPLIMQSLQKTTYFDAVASGPYVDKADYRLDTQLIALQQNFLTKPSVIELAVKVVLTHIADNRIVSSRIISERINCPVDTPYGGVIAANRATFALTTALSKFVVRQVAQDSQVRRNS
jgi:cholesterol transport system auxiliary component